MNLDILSNYYQQWLSQETLVFRVFALIFFALFIDLIQKRALNRIYKRLSQTKTLWDDAAIEAIRRPLSYLIWLLGISYAAAMLGLAWNEMVRELGIIIILTWTLTRFVRFVERNILNEGEVRGKPIDRTTADAVTQLVRISIVITAILVTLETLGFDISAILAFGGIGGIAVGFASKDLLANFFGALMLYLDRPFSIGDWVRSPDREIEGVVERIGWRLTVIRTFDKRPLYIPNSVFASIMV